MSIAGVVAAIAIALLGGAPANAACCYPRPTPTDSATTADPQQCPCTDNPVQPNQWYPRPHNSGAALMANWVPEPHVVNGCYPPCVG